MAKKGEITCKTILVGEMSVGKTSIIERFVNDNFNEVLLSTTTGTFESTTLEFEDYNLDFQLWDTAGQERFRGLTKMFLKDADIVVLVYDITKNNTFEEIKDYWYHQAKENNSEKTSKFLNLKNYIFKLSNWNCWE